MYVVTIDGPAGAGKSTVARALARALGWSFLDTGAMYRAVALAALRAGLPTDDPDQLGRLAANLRVRLEDTRVYLDDEDVSQAIRDPAVSAATRHVADSPAVRSTLVGWQRDFAATRHTVTEGRDQGTIVFPDAMKKFFLTASPEARARRRLAELAPREPGLTLEDVLLAQDERDARDRDRAIAPLRPADDALVVDTTDMNLDEVCALLLREVRAALPSPPDPAPERPA